MHTLCWFEDPRHIPIDEQAVEMAQDSHSPEREKKSLAGHGHDTMDSKSCAHTSTRETSLPAPHPPSRGKNIGSMIVQQYKVTPMTNSASVTYPEMGFSHSTSVPKCMHELAVARPTPETCISRLQSAEYWN